MKANQRGLTVSLAVAALAGAIAFVAGSSPASADGAPACVRWWTQTVLAAVGHNHVVGIENTCDKPAACTVSTDVAPDPIQATVSPKQKVELTTFRGSPASTFRAKVTCALQ